MRTIDKKINIPNILYYTAYFFLIFQSMTRWVLIESVEKISNMSTIIVPTLLLIVFIIKNRKINVKNLLIIMILGVFTLISMKISRGTAVWNIILFIITSKGINIDKVIKFDMIIKIILLLTVYVLYISGFTENVIIYRGSSEIIRHGLGFGHPNTFSVYLMSICLDSLYLTFKTKYRNLSYLFIIFSIVFISIFCDSRSAIYSLIITLIISIFSSLIFKNKLIKICTSKLPIIFTIVSIIATIMYKYKNIFTFIIKINEILSNRILLMYLFFEKYSITLFGNYFIDYHTKSTSTASVLDNSYILLLTKFGIITTIILILAMSARIKKAFKEENIGLVICMIIFTFFGLMENGMIVLFYNPFLLFLSTLIFSNNKKGEVNENK